MPDNVVPFDMFDNELEITSQQSELPRIVLEGGDDVVLFQRWFFEFLDRLEFVQASNEGVGEGCSAVKAAVEKLQARGVRAFGLSDRDRLFRDADWPTLFSIDDAAFALSTQEEHLGVNKLWEIEAYLLVPDLIPRWVRSNHRRAPASQADVDAALTRAIEECESLLQAQPWLATSHRCAVIVPDGCYCNQAQDTFAESCARELRGLQDQHGTAAAVGAHVSEVFNHAPDQPAERLRWLLRYVDTKRLMLRLKHRFNLGDARHKWVLAEFMSVAGMRPTELEHRVRSLSISLNA